MRGSDLRSISPLRNLGAIFGGIMLTSAMVIKAPHPSYKVPGLDAAPVAGGESKPAPALQVNRL